MEKQIVFWAHSYCRSTLEFYSQLAKSIGYSFVVYTWIENLELRSNVGFSNHEFEDLNIEHVGNDMDKAFKLLEKHKDDYNIFCAYQPCKIQQKLIARLISQGKHYGIFSEAPCNMEGYPMHMVKWFYFSLFLPVKLKKFIKNADFVLNFSGYYQETLEKLGWQSEQIISGGYFPPRIPGSHFVARTEKNWEKFTILLSGLHQWHRSPWILIEALGILKQRGLAPKCYITQKGPYLEKIKKLAAKQGLDNVEFLGFVEMSKLLDLYESCSVYVGAGNYEPWGMRLNDVLLCGAPLIVNRGMGGCKMIDEYSCGLTFERNDAKGLADALERMITDKQFYLQTAENAKIAAEEMDPKAAARRYGEILGKYIR